MKTFAIRPLTAELTADYLDFFDHRAFTDDNPNGPCYCTSPNQEEEQIKKMVSEFESFGVKETLRKYAAEMLGRNMIHGYLAYDGDQSIGWCNAADMEIQKIRMDHKQLLDAGDGWISCLEFYYQKMGSDLDCLACCRSRIRCNL